MHYSLGSGDCVSDFFQSDKSKRTNQKNRPLSPLVASQGDSSHTSPIEAHAGVGLCEPGRLGYSPRCREQRFVGTEESYVSSVPENGWYAVLDGEQSGPMELSTFLGAVGEGRADEKTFVWRPGYPEWKKAGDVEGLGNLVRGAAAEAEATQVQPVAPAASASFSDDMRNTVAVNMDEVISAKGSIGDSEQTTVQPEPTSSPASSNTMDALFTDDPAPAADAGGGGFFDVPESSGGEDKVMLYQRRDTSVLFSLDDFGGGGGGGAAQGDASLQNFQERTAESGLIDIRAVARRSVNTASASGGLFESAEQKPATRTDFSTRMSARTEPLVVSRKRKGGGVPVWAAVVGGLAVAAIGALGAMLVSGGGGEQPASAPPVEVAKNEMRAPAPAAVAPKMADEKPVEAVAQVESPREAETPQEVNEAAPQNETGENGAVAEEPPSPGDLAVEAEAKKKPVAKADPVKKSKPVKAKTKPAASKKKKVTSKKASKPKKPAPVAKASPPKPKPKPTPPVAAPKSQKANNATALLNSLGGSGGGGKAAAPAGTAKAGKQKLGKSDIRKAVRKHTSKVVQCYNSGGAPGSGMVVVTAKLTVASSGKVTGVNVMGALGSGPVGSCIASKLKSAKFPAFADGPQTVSMTFRVR